jgi:hypothetical protein
VTVIWIADAARERIRQRVMAEARQRAEDSVEPTRCAVPEARQRAEDSVEPTRCAVTEARQRAEDSAELTRCAVPSAASASAWTADAW